VHQPASPPSLRLLSARHTLGLLTSDEITRVADDLLAGGVYTPSLAEVAGTRYPIMSEVGPLFTASLKELEVPSPASEEAVRTVTWYCLADLAEGRGCPRACLRRLGEDLLYPHEADARRALVPWGGRDLAGWCSEGSYLEALAEEGHIDPEEQAALDRQITAFAARFVRGYCPVPVEAAWLSWSGGTVPGLARSIREEGRFIDLPVLADALEDAGCTDPDVLSHCRHPAPHAGFCWVLDRILEASRL
jgi:hypothetical protein